MSLAEFILLNLTLFVISMGLSTLLFLVMAFLGLTPVAPDWIDRLRPWDKLHDPQNESRK